MKRIDLDKNKLVIEPGNIFKEEIILEDGSVYKGQWRD
jgi:hypothetical protein